MDLRDQIALLESSLQQKDSGTGAASVDTVDSDGDAIVAEILALQNDLRSRSNDYPPGQRPEGPLNFEEVLANAPSSAGKYISDTVTALDPRNWWDMGGAMVNLARGGYEKFTPDVQEHEGLVDATGEAIYNSVGNLNNIKGTFEKDPVGLLSMVAALGTGGGSLIGKLAPAGSKVANIANTVTKASKAADPWNFMINAGKGLTLNAAGRGLLGLKSLDAKHLYQQVAKLPEPKGSNIKDILNTALKHKIPPTHGGVAKAALLGRGFESAIDDAISSIPEGSPGVPINQILSDINNLKKKVSGDSSPNSDADLKAITSVVDAWRDPLMARHYKKHGYNPKKPFWPPGQQRKTPPPQPTVSVRDLHELKKKLYIASSFAAKRGDFDPTANRTRKNIAKRAKEGVEGRVPSVSKLNRDWANIIDLMDPLRQRANVIDRHNSLGLQTLMSALVGHELTDNTMGALMGAAANQGGRFGKVPLAFKMHDWKKGMNPTFSGGLKSQMLKNSTPWQLSRAGLLQGANLSELGKDYEKYSLMNMLQQLPILQNSGLLQQP